MNDDETSAFQPVSPGGHPGHRAAARPKNAPDIAFHANHEILGEPHARRTLDEEAQREIRHGYYAAMRFADAQFGRVLDELKLVNLAGTVEAAAEIPSLAEQLKAITQGGGFRLKRQKN